MTSRWVNGKSWLWTFTTPERTLYRVEESRGREVALDTLGDDYQGTLITDCLASYERRYKSVTPTI